MPREVEITTANLARLLSVTPKAIGGLAKSRIIEKGGKRGSWLLNRSVSGYCEHLRTDVAARRRQAAEARAKLREAQAHLASTLAAKRSGELVETREVEKLWTSKLQMFRTRILGIPHRVQYLSARQTVVLTQELRDALDELSR
jgi:phage terminase Nu1 subunit (DNA packaging protein)